MNMGICLEGYIFACSKLFISCFPKRSGKVYIRDSRLDWMDSSLTGFRHFQTSGCVLPRMVFYAHHQQGAGFSGSPADGEIGAYPDAWVWRCTGLMGEWVRALKDQLPHSCLLSLAVLWHPSPPSPPELRRSRSSCVEPSWNFCPFGYTGCKPMVFCLF